MTNHSDEVFSSLFDDELGEHDKNRMLEQLCKDYDLKCRWKRYQLVSDLLQNNLPPAVNPEFSKSVMNAIDSEPSIISAPRNVVSNSGFKTAITGVLSSSNFSSPFGKRVAGFAIAASVAMVAVMGYQLNSQQQLSPVQVAGSNSPATTLTPHNKNFSVAQPQLVQINPLTAPSGRHLNTEKLATSTRSSTSLVAESKQATPHDPKFNARLHKYLINHNQHFSGTKLQGVMPYARIVVSPTSSKVQEKQ